MATNNNETSPNDDSYECHCTSCCTACISVLFWILSLIFYVLELMFGVWSAVLYFQSERYALFGVVAAAIVIPSLVLMIVSLVWYYDQDKLYQLLREAHPDDQELRGYKKLIGTGSIFMHFIFLSQIYRYGQLIILLITRTKLYDVVTLQRDSGLLRFLHGFLTSAPLVTVQLYVIVLAIITDTPGHRPDLRSSPYPIAMACLISAAASLLLTLLCYVASDRLHSQKRRVVFPAYVITFLWHFCLVPARIAALVLFAVGYGPYVAVVVGVHWIAVAVWTLAERTNFCGDLSTTPPKKRYYLEIPFATVVSFIFLFTFFNARDGSAMARIIVYHLLTSVETLVLSALFYVAFSNVNYAPWAFAVTVGAYLLGVAFMFLYYAAWHPNRTEDCFIIGCPKSPCECCSHLRKGVGPHMGNVDLPLGDEEGGRGEFLTPPVRSHSQQIMPLEADAHQIPQITINNLATITNSTNVDGDANPVVNVRSLATSQDGQQRLYTPLYAAGKNRLPVTTETANRVLSNNENPTHNRRVGVSAGYLVPNGNNSRPKPPTGDGHHSNRQTWFVSRERGDQAAAHPVNSAPLPRRHSDIQLYNYQQHLPSHIHRHQLTNGIILPSPIGEEPSDHSNTNTPRKLSAPPIVHVSSADEPGSKVPSSRLSTISSPVPFTGAPAVQLMRSPYSTRSFVHSDGRVYLEPVPLYERHSRNRNNRNYDDRNRGNRNHDNHNRGNQYSAPRMSLARHRSLSPAETRCSSDGSGASAPPCTYSSSGSRSANCTPRQSPYASRRRRRRRSSNPLHSGDPMVEFTQLYTTSANTSPAHVRKVSSRSSLQLVGGGCGSLRTFSSYVHSSDNRSDVASSIADTEKSRSKSATDVGVIESPTTPTVTGSAIVDRVSRDLSSGVELNLEAGLNAGAESPYVQTDRGTLV